MTTKLTIKPLITAGIFALAVGSIFTLLAVLSTKKTTPPPTPTLTRTPTDHGSLATNH